MNRLPLLLSILIFFALLVTGAEPTTPPVAPQVDATATTKAEAALGKKTADEIERSSKMVKDDVAMAKLNAMTAIIVPFTERPGVVYTCKIIEDNEPNAMSIPGGTIYFTSALLKAVESDDELAGVMAHEMAHNSLGHVQKMLNSKARGNLAWLLATVASVFVRGSSGDVPPTAAISTMSSLVVQSLNNGYQEDMEEEADMHAVDYLYNSKKYDPLGMYSVMLGFKQMEQSRAADDPGFLRTHPASKERLVAIEKHLKELGVSINLWRVLAFRAVMVAPKGEEKGYQLTMSGLTIVTLTEANGSKTAAERITTAVATINDILHQQYIQQFNVDFTVMDENAYITFDRKPVLVLTAFDAATAGVSLTTLAENASNNVKKAIWQEIVKHS